MLSACASPVITFQTANVDYGSDRSEVKIEYPVALSQNKTAADSINKAITACYFTDETPSFDAIIAQAKQYLQDSIGYANYGNWNGFSNSRLISLYIEHYTFTGGAHGSTLISALTFDTKTGKEIDIRQHITDTLAFRKLLVDEYVLQNNLNINTTAGEIGYFTELSELPIPATIELTDKGVKIYYQQYEIACYAVGITTATIPYDRLKGILSLDTVELKPIEINK